MMLAWHIERVLYGCNIIFETHQRKVEMIYGQKYHMVYFLYFVYGARMWVGAFADLITLE